VHRGQRHDPARRGRDGRRRQLHLELDPGDGPQRPDDPQPDLDAARPRRLHGRGHGRRGQHGLRHRVGVPHQPGPPPLPFDPNVCTIYDFPYDANIGDPNPDWQFDNNTQTLCQQSNAKASALFCGWTLDNATINGRFRVNTAADDDWVGFMWGIQDTDHFYVFTWKQAGQQSTTCGPAPFAVPGGMQVKRIGVADPNVPLACPDVHAPNDTANSVLLQSVDQFTTMGWADNTEYVFDLTHLANGDMTIVVRNAMNNQVIAMTTFNDTTYPNGQFGMYTKSQEDACFAGFEVDCM
jgi:hypothetical protein